MFTTYTNYTAAAAVLSLLAVVQFWFVATCSGSSVKDKLFRNHHNLRLNSDWSQHELEWMTLGVTTAAAAAAV